MTSASTKCLLLFALNWLDAQLTIIWVRSGWATEGNGLMAHLLDAGDLPFLAVKLAVGAVAAYIFYRFSRLPLARRGASFALGLYLCLMFVHAATGLTGAGLIEPESPVARLTRLPETLLSFIS
jgi:Domain of unknown function (DUF5658)